MLRKKTLSHTIFYPAKILSKAKASQFIILELCKAVKRMKSKLTNGERISGNNEATQASHLEYMDADHYLSQSTSLVNIISYREKQIKTAMRYH